MPNESRFFELVASWNVHCNQPQVSLSSRPQTYIECDAYVGITSMGKEALPLVRRAIDESGDKQIPLIGLPQLLDDLVGTDFQVPPELLGRLPEIRDYARTWLDFNMSRYSQ
jgi:hypothetical protein